MKTFLTLIVLLFCLAMNASALEPSVLDTVEIEKLTGLKGTYNEQEKVFKVTYPRSDLGIKINQWQMPAFMGLTTWAAFTKGRKDNTMIMGDFVLLEDEVNPVMSVLLKAGLSVTALHNHFFYDQPKVYFMHIGGEGKTAMLATGVKVALEKINQIRSANIAPINSFDGSNLPEKNNINAAKLSKVFGFSPQEKDGMVKFVIGRRTKMLCGCEIGKEMGVNTWAAFAGSDKNAIVDGDFACLENELQAVLKSLRSNAINIVAIHNHMTTEEPRYIFLHYWAQGKAAELARKLKSTIDILITE